MDEFDKILKRMDLKQIATFILHGEGSPETDRRSYQQRINDADNALRRKLEELCTENQNAETFFDEMSEAMAMREQVFFELGMVAWKKLSSEKL